MDIRRSLACPWAGVVIGLSPLQTAFAQAPPTTTADLIDLAGSIAQACSRIGSEQSVAAVDRIRNEQAAIAGRAYNDLLYLRETVQQRREAALGIDAQLDALRRSIRDASARILAAPSAQDLDDRQQRDAQRRTQVEGELAAVNAALADMARTNTTVYGGAGPYVGMTVYDLEPIRDRLQLELAQLRAPSASAAQAPLPDLPTLMAQEDRLRARQREVRAALESAESTLRLNRAVLALASVSSQAIAMCADQRAAALRSVSPGTQPAPSLAGSGPPAAAAAGAAGTASVVGSATGVWEAQCLSSRAPAPSPSRTYGRLVLHVAATGAVSGGYSGDDAQGSLAGVLEKDALRGWSRGPGASVNFMGVLRAGPSGPQGHGTWVSTSDGTRCSGSWRTD